MRAAICVYCGQTFGLLDRLVAVRVERPVAAHMPPVVGGIPMHGDCERKYLRDQQSDYQVTERSPTGYPLRFERRASWA
jgi:hypothetical protein